MADHPTTDISDFPTRYTQLLNDIIQATLKGKIRAKEQVYQMLIDGVSPGTGEIFERCLSDRQQTLQQQLESTTDELKQAKANRSLRALQTIDTEWQRAQTINQTSAAVAATAQAITTADTSERLMTLVHALDPNQAQGLTLPQLKQLAKTLQSQPQSPVVSPTLSELATGLVSGIEAWQRLEPNLMSWIYQGQAQLGFAGVPGQSGPWSLWAKQVNSQLPQTLFQTLALQASLPEIVVQQPELNTQQWVELAVILQCLQRGLVSWFDQMVYDAKLGAKLSISTYLVFAVIWSQLATGFSQHPQVEQRDRWVEASWQMTLQILRLFSQQAYFPLYGGVFASFTGEFLQDALSYLDAPLRQVAGTQEKARILTLLGYSQQTQGRYKPAIAFHQQALEIARIAGDHRCEIANLNHLSRIAVAQKDYEAAIRYSQQALIASRQLGDRLGEANALANYGYSEVLSARAATQATPETYESAITYLQQGLKLSEQTGDRQSQALCCSSLGIAYVIIEQPQAAISYLETGWQAAQFSGDIYLQGLNLAYLAQAHYNLQNWSQAIMTGSLGMYLLEQIGAQEWRQPAGLLTILQGQLATTPFQTLLSEHRPKIIAVIGVDGFDHLLQLLQKYQASLE